MTFEGKGLRVILPLDPSQGERYTEPVRDEDRDILDHIYKITPAPLSSACSTRSSTTSVDKEVHITHPFTATGCVVGRDNDMESRSAQVCRPRYK